jgi:uncharacterized membrane protein YkoI
MILRSFRLISACGLTIAASFLAPASADPGWNHGGHDHGHRWHRDDHEAARAAVERGEIKPLAELLGQVKDKLPGDITGVELERRHGTWLYEFRVIDEAGRLFDVYVDAKSGEIRRTRED